jgi:NAD(P) transhydrogenase
VIPPTENFDLVVIGSGPGGEKGAAQAAYFGKRVALVERSAEVGGASVHTGTLPSKTLREAALYLAGFRRRELYGMSLKLDRRQSLGRLVGRLKDVTDRQTHQIHRNLDRHAIMLVPGSAAFEDARTVVVRDPEGRIQRRLSADVVLIATGSSPLPPRGITTDDPDVVDSDQILSLDRVPESLTVVGGGVIGTEYACLFAALGTKVVVVEGRDRLLAGVDEELATVLQLSLERMGAEILLGDAVVSIARDPAARRNALHLHLKSGRRVRADKILFSAGRTGNTRGLNLEAAGVSVNERGHIPVDAHFRTAAPGIYAVGDVIGFPALASTSMEQGRVAMCHAFGIAYKTEMSPLLPYGIFAVPEISSIGPSEQELRERGIDYEVGRARFENNARGQVTGDRDGLVKLLFDPKTRRLLAAHILGDHATELIHIPMFVMAAGGSIDAFIDAVFNFPTLSEAFKYAAYDGLQRLARRGTRPVLVRSRDAGSDPATRPWFVGVDLSREGSAPGRPIAVCVMDRWRRCRLLTWSYEVDGRGLLLDEVERDGFVLALGASGVETPPLLDALRRHGHGIVGEAADPDAEVALVRPARLWRAWSGGRAPRGATARHKRYEILRAQALELPVGFAAVHDDQLDAAASAYAAYLWATRQATFREGEIRPEEIAPAT